MTSLGTDRGPDCRSARHRTGTWSGLAFHWLVACQIFAILPGFLLVLLVVRIIRGACVSSGSANNLYK